MIIKNLYRYVESNGQVVITPNMRNVGDRIYQHRYIADENKVLIKDNIEASCIDAFNIDGWQEIEKREE